MTERELVTRFMEGQIGRRAFIRRLVESGVSVGAAVAYAGTLSSTPAWATHDGAPDQYDENRLIKVTKDGGIDPQKVTVIRGGLVQWDFKNGPHEYPDRYYTMQDPLDFIDFNGNFFWPGHRVERFFAAGSFPYNVEVRTRGPKGGFVGPPVTHHGKVKALMRVSKARVEKGHEVTVSWASKPAPNKYSYDVEMKVPDENSFVPWKIQVSQPNAEFSPGQKGTYHFRARLLRKSDDKPSGWSPVRSLKSV